MLLIIMDIHLSIASSYGHIDIVKTLLSSGADINLADNDEMTPLYVASINGQIHVVKTFIVVTKKNKTENFTLWLIFMNIVRKEIWKM